jgi:acyl-CoA synthetase (AMP-forming)/AMP-acid ligase II
MPTEATLVDLLRQQADRYRDKVAFSFSYNGDGENSTRLTYHELDLKARAIAAGLQQQGATGERVLVLCSPGLEAVAGFFGCVYASAVPVPVHQRLAPRLAAVVPDAQANFALATEETQAHIRAALGRLVPERPLRWCVPDAAVEDADKWVTPDVDPGATALLQYTAGSTRSPKGVLVTHRNLLCDIEAARQVWDGDDQAIAVFWVPQHHDMGLVGAVIHQVHVGCTTHLMSPTAFIKRPMRWLEAISRHRATFTATPYFAFERCVEHSTPEERAALDLSSLSAVITGAEPIRAAGLRAFADAFAPAGFRPEAFSPAYGLAEATVMACGGSNSPVPLVQHIDRAALSEDHVVEATSDDALAVAMVGCGPPLGGQRVVIVDPETHRLCGPDEVGEIWLAGPSVAQGYWGRPEETERTFSAVLAETGEGPFLRTGDMGFLRLGEMFITGRWKDLVIIRGGKYYPNDIEATVQDCHPALVSGRGAVFSVPRESDRAEQLVVVQEVDRQQAGEVELTDVVEAIRAAITEHHGLAADAVLLVEHLRIPTTSTGKIQRGQCRQQYLDRDLEGIVEWYAPLPPADSTDLLTKARTDPEVAARLSALAKLVSARPQQRSRQS